MEVDGHSLWRVLTKRETASLLRWSIRFFYRPFSSSFPTMTKYQLLMERQEEILSICTIASPYQSTLLFYCFFSYVQVRSINIHLLSHITIPCVCKIKNNYWNNLLECTWWTRDGFIPSIRARSIKCLCRLSTNPFSISDRYRPNR